LFFLYSKKFQKATSQDRINKALPRGVWTTCGQVSEAAGVNDKSCYEYQRFHYRKISAILNLINHLDRIQSFTNADPCDANLPSNEDRGVCLWGLYREQIRGLARVGFRLSVFGHGTDRDIPRIDFEPRAILPFTSRFVIGKLCGPEKNPSRGEFVILKLFCKEQCCEKSAGSVTITQLGI